MRTFSSSASASSQIGFIGLGNMGSHMANNLLQKGHEVMVFDIDSSSVQKLVESGASAGSDPSDIAMQCETIVTMLPSNPHVKSVYMEDEKSLLPYVGTGALCIDASTIDPSVSQQVANECDDHGVAFVDAPVSGGVGGAEQGTLTFMVGGTSENFERAKPVLECMGKNIVHCGDVGMGEAAKICNNMLLAVSMIGTAEVMHLGEKLGMDPKVLAGIINTSSGRCWSSDTYNPTPGVIEGVPASNNYDGGFGVSLMRKDIGLAADAAKNVGAPVALGTQAHELYRLMEQHGFGKKDFSSIYKFLKGN